MERFLLSFVAAGLVWSLGTYVAWAAEGAPTTRPAAVAGSWYPGEPAALKKLLQQCLDRVKKPELPGEPVVVIAPHAGYRFSGPCAAAAFKAVEGKSFSRVILIGPSHGTGGPFSGGAVPTVTHFATPLGNVPLDTETCRKLIAADGFVAADGAHAREHCLEMELPFLQCVLKDFGKGIVPIVVGRVDAKTLTKMAATLRGVADEKTLVVVSSDFVHYGPDYGYVPFKQDVQANIARLDGAAIDRILAVDHRGFVDLVEGTRATICGRWAIAVALEAFADRADVEGVALGYAASGAMLNDWTNSVSYAAIALCRGAAAPLTEAERKVLLRIARDQVREHLRSGKQLADVEKRYELPPRLKKKAPAFVTLTRDGQLRGCIGHLQPVEPLYASVLHNAVSACKDPRFVDDPVTAAEEPKLHVEISVLSRFKQIGSVDEVKVGRDGLIIRSGRRQGLLLPQVPVQQKWDLQRYLVGLCRKAALPDDAWKAPETRMYRFTGQVFGEPHERGREATTQPR